MKKIITITALPLLLAACSSTSMMEETKLTPTDLQHHHWELSEIDGEPLVLIGKQKVPDLEISENMQSHGLAGCNTFKGQAQIHEKTGQFRIDKMAMTMKMCIGDAMVTEQVVASTLSAWSEISLGKQSLTLTNDEHTLTFELKDWM